MRSKVFASLIVPAGLVVSLIYACAHFKQSLGDGDVVLAQSAPVQKQLRAGCSR
jgi:hypothetical protein